jgi:hypothetical protein
LVNSTPGSRPYVEHERTFSTSWPSLAGLPAPLPQAPALHCNFIGFNPTGIIDISRNL